MLVLALLATGCTRVAARRDGARAASFSHGKDAVREADKRIAHNICVKR